MSPKTSELHVNAKVSSKQQIQNLSAEGTDERATELHSFEELGHGAAAGYMARRD